MNWYVLFVQTGQEDILCELLNRVNGFQAHSCKVEHYRRDKKEIVLKSLFPGYVFILTGYNQLDFDSKLRSMEIKKGLIKELKYEGSQALSKEEIASISNLLGDSFTLKMSYGHIVGKKLKIDAGPLVGYDDYVVSVDKHNHLLKLDLFFLNQQWVCPVTIIEDD